MSTFDNISSIVSLEQLNNTKINENKDYIILFFYMEGCGACKVAKPIVCKIIENNLSKKNCKIVKVHNIDIKDEKLNNLYTGGVPAFRILKRTHNGYVLFDHENEFPNKKYRFTIDGFSHMDYIDNKIKHLSTENTLLNWIENLNNLHIKEGYNSNTEETDIQLDDGSGYTIMKTHSSPKIRNSHKSLNKIINENIKNINLF